MRLNRRKTVIASVFLSCMLAVVAQQVLAQNPTVKGKGKLATTIHATGSVGVGTQGIVDLNPDTPNVLTSVPLKMTFVMTDIIVSNANGTAAQFQLFEAGVATLTHQVEVGANSTFAYNFGTGLEIPASGHMNIFATGGTINYTIVGYLRKGS
jgi:hypothetical protein